MRNRDRTALGGLACILGLLAADAGAQTELFVSPAGSGTAFTLAAPGSLSGAMARVRALNKGMAADIVVTLRGGRYPLAKAIEFGPEDAGANGHRVRYRSRPGEKAVLSGGVPITGWVPDGPNGVKAGANGLRFRQLYVNGLRAVRARTPNRDNDLDMGPYFWLRRWDIPGQRIRLDTAGVPKGADAAGVEMVIKSHWATARIRPGSVVREGNESILTPVEKDRTRLFNTPYFPMEPDQTYYFENGRDMLDAPGEWFLDAAANTVHYRLRPGESPTTLSAYAPVSEGLLRFRGTRAITLEGLVLEHTTWLEGDTSAIIDPQGAWRFPAAIDVADCESIRFVRNVIRHTAAQGAMFSGSTRANVLHGNILYDIGANPVLYKGAGSQGDSATHNTISLAGREHSSALGILAQLTERLVLERNGISHAPYGGIALGWNWFEDITEARGNLVRANHIHHVMELHDDAAGVYTLGRMDGTLIERNHIHDVQRSRWAERFSCSGIYLDQGSMNITVKDNVLQGLEEPTHENPNVPGAKNNTWINNETNDPGIIAGAGPAAEFRLVPRAAFKVDAAKGTAPFTLRADASASKDDSGIVRYEWDFGDGAQAAGVSAVHAYAQPGTYILKLRVFDKDTLYDYASLPIQVNVGAGNANLALKAPSKSSSDFSQGSIASFGNDGDVNTIWASAVADAGVHWQVDLGKSERIYQLELVSRQDGDQTPSRQNFEVRGSNDRGFATSVLLAAQGPTIFPAKGTWYAAVTDTGAYRYLRVVKPLNGHFHFAELRAFGKPPPTVALGRRGQAYRPVRTRARIHSQRFGVERIDPGSGDVTGRWDGAGRRSTVP